MSNVLERNREFSELEFFVNAIAIRAELVRYLRSAKIPKRAYWTYSVRGIEYAMNLMSELVAANSIYPTDEAELEQRRFHQNNAIVACEQIVEHIHFMVETLDTVSIDDFKILGDMLFKEVNLIKKWRSKNKVLTQKYEIT